MALCIHSIHTRWWLWTWKEKTWLYLVILLELSDVTNKYEVLGDPVDIVYWDFQKILTISFKNGHSMEQSW